MKAFPLKGLALACALVTAAPAFAQELSSLEEKMIEAVKKDIAGGQTCFKGEIQKKHKEMEDMYGGRFGGEPNVTLVTVNEVGNRYPSKYCSTVDKKGKETDDEKKIVARRCVNEDKVESVLVVSFGASTSGTFETEGLVFKVVSTDTSELLVKPDASYNADGDEIISHKSSSKISCVKARF